MVLYTPESRPLLLNVKYIFERTPYLYRATRTGWGKNFKDGSSRYFRLPITKSPKLYFRFRLREISITRIQPFCIFSSVPIRPKVVTGVIWGHRSYRVDFLPSD